MPFRRRFNPPEPLQVALQRFYQSGDPEDLHQVAVVAGRAGEFVNLPASIFLQIARDFPDLFPDDAFEAVMVTTTALASRNPYRSAPLGSLLEILHVVAAVHEEDWFPLHTLATTCPRDHEEGQPNRAPDGRYLGTVSFDMIELGANSYRRVESTAPGEIEVGGFPEGGDPEGSVLLCGVCNATWPIGPEIAVNYA